MGQRRGYASGLAAYLIWGFFPIYFHALRSAGALEILAHRIVWSALSVAVLITAVRRWAAVRALLRQPRKLAGISVAATLIAGNWATYIYGVNSGHVIETSLGYFITPLISVLLGVVVFRERPTTAQWIAIGLGAIAVGVITVDYRRLPWIALGLAASFGLYGLVKKRLSLPPTDGLLMEASALFVPAVAYFGWLTAAGRSTFTGVSVSHTTLLVLAGALTAGPLLLFADAANRISMTQLGILQYAAPILQLLCGLVVFHEPMPVAQLIGFILVWVAIVIFTMDALRRTRRTRAAMTATPGSVEAASTASTRGEPGGLVTEPV
ncbi:MAG TPA: EamA family transporter RarD [Micromonosporaceae bacterium]|jgi:chloramphenicol-sensitive protein RarD|nr:EamA family transporter RarD [Micromonosporaceae bacterium]